MPYSRAAFINISALKCGVSSRAALNRKKYGISFFENQQNVIKAMIFI